MKIKKGDQVLVVTGKDKGKKGKIMAVFPQENQVLVEGVNLRKKHTKPRQSGQKGEVVQIPGSINASNVKIICPKCGGASRLGHKVAGEQKFRVCVKCHQEI